MEIKNNETVCEFKLIELSGEIPSWVLYKGGWVWRAGSGRLSFIRHGDQVMGFIEEPATIVAADSTVNYTIGYPGQIVRDREWGVVPVPVTTQKDVPTAAEMLKLDELPF